MTARLLVEEVFPVSFIEGVMVVGIADGSIHRGDQLSLVKPNNGIYRGHIALVHIHQLPNDPPNRVRVGVGGEAASVVESGDVLEILETAPREVEN
jgi:hypothetical protein